MITVQDIINHLQQSPPDTEVELDKDGWMEDESSNPEDPATVIRERGLFTRFAGYLIINN